MLMYKKPYIDLVKEFIKNNSLKLAIILWCIFGTLIISHVVTSPGRNTVTPEYWEASMNWLSSNGLYGDGSGGFKYFPQSAIIQIPFAIMPFTLAEALWRIINISFYAFSCYLISSLFLPLPNKVSFLVISVFSIPLAWESARNGQINLTLASFFGIAAFALAHEKYRLSVFICILGMAFKQYMIVPLLLICFIFPKPTFLVAIFGLIVLFLFPFLFQTPTYVWHQYQECFNSMRISLIEGQEGNFAYIFGVLKALGISTSGSVQMFYTVIFALAVFVLSLYLSRKSPNKDSSVVIIALTVAYILLFSSKTENNTYCLIGSFLAYFYIKAFALSLSSQRIYTIVVVLCYSAMVGSYEIGKYLTPGRVSWPAPLGLAVFMTYTLLFILPKIIPQDSPQSIANDTCI